MDLFKNEVGRPSNETLKKRKQFKVFVSVFAIIAVLLVGFGVYKAFAPEKIEGEGLNANVSSNNKFVFKEKAGYQSIEACHKVIAPKDAKNWRVEIKYKQAGKITWKTMLKRDHYNDGATYDNICFDYYNNKGTYRVLVKWTKGKNNLTYSSPKKWKPDGWKTNLLTGWAYKDYDYSNINILINNTLDGFDKKVEYGTYTDVVTLANNTGKTYYYRMYNTTYNIVNDYATSYKTQDSGCIAYNKTKTIENKVIVNKDIYNWNADIQVYSSKEKCEEGFDGYRWNDGLVISRGYQYRRK